MIGEHPAALVCVADVALTAQSMNFLQNFVENGYTVLFTGNALKQALERDPERMKSLGVRLSDIAGKKNAVLSCGPGRILFYDGKLSAPGADVEILSLLETAFPKRKN